MRFSRFVALLVPSLLALPARASNDTFGLGDGHTGPLAVAAADTVVNTYVHLTADAAVNANALTVKSAAGFAAGDLVLAWQSSGLAMPASGNQMAIDLTSAQVGHWELGRLAAAAGTTLSLTAPLVSAFAANVTQIIKVPEYTTVAIAAGGSITAKAWDGQAGGIVAFLANGNIIDNGAISADGTGDRGGLLVNGAGTFGCTQLDPSFSPLNGAQKGEGIVPAFYGPMHIGMGNIANGAGGGDCHNAGGGGGGNGGQGGRGGRSWKGDMPASRTVGGFGGSKLTYTAIDHLALGGGGGAGEENNDVGTGGGNGGGVVFIRGNSLMGSGKVTADGQSIGYATDPGRDGQGGGGAGGTIYLRFVGTVSCLSIEAIGGAGGSTHYDQHGTGGGGAGGHILIQTAMLACPPSVVAGLAGVQNDPNAPDGIHYGGGPLVPTDPVSIGVAEFTPPGGYCSNNSQCPVSAPICDTQHGFCVGCTSNKDCSGTKPICNLMTHVCGPCTSDTQCSGATPACEPSGACGQCSATNKTQCVGNKPICDVMKGVCRGCASDADCGGTTPACQAGGACGQCSPTNTTQCKVPTPLCDFVKGMCRGCLTDADCSGATPACEPNGLCGQCSATNQTQCISPTPICNVPAGVCHGCTSDADCGGNTPACQPNGNCGQCSSTNQTQCKNPTPACVVVKGLCGPCTSDNDCGGMTPACQPTGVCGQCSATNQTQCKMPTPICDTGKGLCRACVTDADCGGMTPACQPNGLCGQCSSTNQTLCKDPTPVCNTGIGMCVACTLVNTDGGMQANACMNKPDGHVCENDGMGGVFCGCSVDADCGGKMSGRVCNNQIHKCIDGCSPAPNRNGCPQGKFCSSKDITGQTIGVCSTTCSVDADCVSTPLTPFCLAGGDGGVSSCVTCRNDPDCANMPSGMTVCTTDTHTCVQCTPSQTGGCSPNGPGAACLQGGVCGCFIDGDCGGTMSGRVCDTTVHTCQNGCRGTGGNGCPSGLLCTSGNAAIGMCINPPDMTTIADMTTPDLKARPDASAPPDFSSAGGFDSAVLGPDAAGFPLIAGGGCSCAIGGHGETPRGALWAMAFALAALALARRRRPRK